MLGMPAGRVGVGQGFSVGPDHRRSPDDAGRGGRAADLAAMIGVTADDVADGPLWVDLGVEQLHLPLRSVDAVRRGPRRRATAAEARRVEGGEALVYLWAPTGDETVEARLFFTRAPAPSRTRRPVRPARTSAAGGTPEGSGGSVASCGRATPCVRPSELHLAATPMEASTSVAPSTSSARGAGPRGPPGEMSDDGLSRGEGRTRAVRTTPQARQAPAQQSHRDGPAHNRSRPHPQRPMVEVVGAANGRWWPRRAALDPLRASPETPGVGSGILVRDLAVGLLQIGLVSVACLVRPWSCSDQWSVVPSAVGQGCLIAAGLLARGSTMREGLVSCCGRARGSAEWTRNRSPSWAAMELGVGRVLGGRAPVAYVLLAHPRGRLTVRRHAGWQLRLGHWPPGQSARRLGSRVRLVHRSGPVVRGGLAGGHERLFWVQAGLGTILGLWFMVECVVRWRDAAGHGLFVRWCSGAGIALALGCFGRRPHAFDVSAQVSTC